MRTFEEYVMQKGMKQLMKEFKLEYTEELKSGSIPKEAIDELNRIFMEQELDDENLTMHDCIKRKGEAFEKTTYTVTKFNILACEYEWFYVEVLENDYTEMIDFYLCHMDSDIKQFMFALDKEEAPEEKWEEIIKENVCNYIYNFVKDYMGDFFENN